MNQLFGPRAAAARAVEEIADLLPALRAATFETEPPAEGAAYALAVTVSTLARSGLRRRVPEIARTFPDTALDLLEEARRAGAIDGDHRLQATVAEYMAATLQEQGELEKAARVIEDALDQFPDARGSRPGLQIRLAEYARYRGQAERALDLLYEAECGLQDEPYHRTLRCDVESLRGSVYLDLGQTDRAHDAFAEARRLAESMDDNTKLVVLARYVEYLISAEDGDAVERELAPVLARNDLDGLARAHFLMLLGQAQSRSKPQEAIRTLEAALAIPDITASDRSTAELHLARTLYNTGDLDGAAGLLDRLEEERRRGFATSELGGHLLASLRARVALARGADPEQLADALDRTRRAFDGMIADWSRAPRDRAGVGFLAMGSRRAMASDLVLLTVECEADGAARALGDLMRAQACGSLAQRLQVETGTPEDVRRTLVPPDGGVLAYLPGAERSHVFVVDRDGVEHYVLRAPYGTLDAARMELVRLALRPPASLPSEDRELHARELAAASATVASRLLPDEVRARIAGWDSVVVTGLDVCGYLPFELLPDVGGEPLGLRRAVTLLPSLPLGLFLAERAREARRDADVDLWLVAGPAREVRETPDERALLGEAWEHLGPLSTDPSTYRGLSDAYDPARIRTFIGPRATFAALADEGLAHALCLHVYTHGVHDPSRERPAGLLLAAAEAQPDVAWCEDVERLRVPPLVVLSACGAARGPMRRGEDGVSHLGGAFLGAGARAVVLAYADLEETATLATMEVFHARIVAGDSPARALLAARRALSAERPEPFYWGLVHVVGLGTEPLFGE